MKTRTPPEKNPLRNPPFQKSRSLSNHPGYQYKVWSPTLEQDEACAEVVTYPWKPGEQELNSIAYRFAKNHLESFNIHKIIEITVFHITSKTEKTFHAALRMVPEVHLIDN